jgi:energy-coupling factor transporter ATP-binding protein EcfA2
MAALEAAPVKLLLLGEQATGKSSLLVALYGALVHHRAGALRIVRTVDEVEFLSRGLRAFGRQESVRRTEVDSRARLLLEVAHGDRVVDIELPDRSGELLKHMIDARAWDPELHRQLGEAAGAMLFLRADQLNVEFDGPAAGPPVTIDGMQPSWAPTQMPADVRTVDLLQAMVEERATALPVAVILSAWDRAGADDVQPAAWLAERVPLLQQFLATHPGQLPHRVFGVSAQGAEFMEISREPDDAAEDPWDRAFLVGPEGARGTLAEPILWLIDAVR